MCELFNEANVSYNLRQDVRFHSYNVKTVLYGSDSCHTLDLKFGIWFFLITEIVHVRSAKYTFLI